MTRYTQLTAIGLASKGGLKVPSAVMYTKVPRQYSMLWEEYRPNYIARIRELEYAVEESGSVGE